MREMLLVASDLESDLGRNPGGNLAIWLSFIGVMFTAGVTVIIAALNRGRKELHGDHTNVQKLLRSIEDNAIRTNEGVEHNAEAIDGLRQSIVRLHDRLDTHLEHHNAEHRSPSDEMIRRVLEGDRDEG